MSPAIHQYHQLSSPPSISSSSSSSSSASPPPRAERIPVPHESGPALPRTVSLADVPGDVMERLTTLHATATDIPRSCIKGWAGLIGPWLSDLNARLRSGKTATNAPIAAGAAIVFAVPFTADDVHKRMSAVRDGQWQTAFALAASSQSEFASRRPLLDRQRSHRSTGYMERRAFAKAIRALQPKRATESMSVVEDSMRRKVPRARHLWSRTTPPVNPPTTTRFPLSKLRKADPDNWENTVWKAVRGISNCASPGPSGLRREHLDVAARVSSARIPQCLAEVIDTICAGLVPADDRYITGCALSPVPKAKPGDYRPIGVGEVIRRVAARIGVRALCKLVEPELHGKRQYGVSRDGGHHVYHSTRLCAAQGQHVIEFDIENAFGEIDRERILRVVGDLDDVRPLVEALYGNDCLMTLRGSTTTLICDRGVVQGCPLASVLFALALQSAIDDARAQVNPALGMVTDVWYADDGRAASHSAIALEAFITSLRSTLAARGLTLAPHKSLFIVNAAYGDDHPDVTRLARHAKRVNMISCVGLPVCPVGLDDADALIQSHFDGVVTDALGVVSSLKTLEHPHHAVQVLACAGMWSRIQYHVRGYVDAIPNDTLDAAERGDIDVLRWACGTHGDMVGFPQWMIATLPLTGGGLGIPSVTVEALIHKSLCPSIRHDHAVRCPPRPKSADGDVRRKRVSILTAGLIRATLPLAKVAALMDAATSGARTWLTAPLCRADGTLVANTRVANTMLAQAIGCDVLPAGHHCLRNGESCRPSAPPACDPAGQHITNCAFVMTSRHNAVRDVIVHELITHAPHVHPLKEQGCNADGQPYVPPHDQQRVGDVVIHDHANRNWMFLDVAAGGLNMKHLDAACKKSGVYPKQQHIGKMEDPRREYVLRAKAQHVALAFGPTGAPSWHTRKFFTGVLAPILDAGNGFGRATYPSSVRLLTRCQIAILQSHATRLVALADELDGRSAANRNTAEARAVAAASERHRAATIHIDRTVADRLRNTTDECANERLGASRPISRPLDAAARNDIPPNTRSDARQQQPDHRCSPRVAPPTSGLCTPRPVPPQTPSRRASTTSTDTPRRSAASEPAPRQVVMGPRVIMFNGSTRISASDHGSSALSVLGSGPSTAAAAPRDGEASPITLPQSHRRPSTYIDPTDPRGGEGTRIYEWMADQAPHRRPGVGASAAAGAAAAAAAAPDAATPRTGVDDAVVGAPSTRPRRTRARSDQRRPKRRADGDTRGTASSASAPADMNSPDAQSCSTGPVDGPEDGGAPVPVKGFWRPYTTKGVVRQHFLAPTTRRARTSSRRENHSSRPREGYDPGQRNHVPRPNTEHSPIRRHSNGQQSPYARRPRTIDPVQREHASQRSNPDFVAECLQMTPAPAPPRQGLTSSSQEFHVALQEVFTCSPDQLQNCNHGTEPSLPSSTE